MRGDQRDRDLEAFSWFFTTEYPQVVRLLRVVVQDAAAAEDLAQDAFVRLHRHWEKVSRYENPEAWIRRVALNRAFSHLRRDRLRRTVEVASVDRSAVSPDSALAATSAPTSCERSGSCRVGKPRSSVCTTWRTDR